MACLFCIIINVFSASFAKFILTADQTLTLCISAGILKFADHMPFIYFISLITCSVVSARFCFAFSFSWPPPELPLRGGLGKRHRFLHRCRLLRHAVRHLQRRSLFAIFLCKLCNTYRRFSHGCLSIHTSLTCDHKIRVFDVVLKFCLISTMLIPDSRTASVKVRNANPIPPAAPVPGYFASAFGKRSFASSA